VIDATMVAFLGLAAYLAWSAAVNAGPAFRAAGGAGTHGYFIPQSEQCDKGNCTWYGDFRLPDGRGTRGNVTIADTSSADLRAGTPVAATDVGDDDTSNGGSGVVFPAHDPGAWSGTVTDLVWGVGWAATLLSLLLGQVLCRSRLPQRHPQARAAIAIPTRRRGRAGARFRPRRCRPRCRGGSGVRHRLPGRR
jgi:hypothetical protein